MHAPRTRCVVCHGGARASQGLEAWDGKLHAGFTASTGRLYAEHSITEWQMYEAERPANDPSKPGMRLGF